jgi:predicted  nucleic acid-binding Zn-ribbon protein
MVVATLLAAGCASEMERPAGAQVQQAPGKADEFLVTDCLLPGQIRRLGSQMTFLTPRRPIKTSARDCEIRGGEYVAFDRANYATALKVWLPLAQQGDANAQTYVGEIFEKGLGVAPDYGAAAEWYRRAAESGYARAAINLGNLYEQGLGLPKDPKLALNWYRRAAGLPELSFEIAPGKTSAELAQFRAQIADLQRQLQTKQTEADRSQRELDDLRRGLDQRRGEADTERGALARMRQELDDLRRLAGASQARMAELQRGIAEGEVRLAAKDREVMDLRASLAKDEADSKARLVAAERELASLRAALAKAEADASAQRAGLEQLRQQVDRAGPQIELVQVQLIEPEMVAATRDIQVRRQTAAAGRAVMLVGRVAAPAGLRSLTINGREETVDQENLFRSQIPVTDSVRTVKIVATDRASRSSTLEFLMPTRVEQVRATPEPRLGSPGAKPEAREKVGIRPPRISFGNYHALIIGNNDYRALPPLKTAVNDAQEIARILKEQYGFNVTLLLDARRYDIMQALNTMREKLASKDNLLIYYAGHGELDQKNQRGHWLPVDAERTSTANWISNGDITDILNVMEVKQLLLVADSCYSGTLTRSALAQLEPGMTEEELADAIAKMARQRSRMVMTSGGLEPVLDSAGGRHSAFAQAFIQLLKDNDGVLLGRELFRRLQLRVAAMAQRLAVPQVPEYAPIRFAGHEAGDFLFVRAN